MTEKTKVINKLSGFLLAAALLTGCSSHPVKPLEPSVGSLSARMYIAHGASSGREPLNSLEAVQATLPRDDYDGIELDIVLTGDSVPILAHDPWLSNETCRRYDGQDFEPVFIKDVYFSELRALFECRFSSAENASSGYHPLASLSEALNVVQHHPDKVLYLDLKIQPEMTLEAAEYGAELFLALTEQNISNSVFVEVPSADHVAAVSAEMAELNIKNVVSYPAFYAGENWDVVGFLAAVRTLFISDDPVETAMKSNADALMSPTVVMSYRAVRQLHENNILFGTFLVHDEASMQVACDHGADIIITDTPPEEGCDSPL